LEHIQFVGREQPGSDEALGALFEADSHAERPTGQVSRF
jgi:hypothetical protein